MPPPSNPNLLPELFRPLPIAEIGTKESERRVESNESERTALAKRFGLQAIRSLSGELRLRWVSDELIRLEGNLRAEIIQLCVVSLEPITAKIEQSFTRLLAFGAAPESEGEIEIDLSADEPPDPVQGETIDIGEILAEELALAIDPYPRKPGATTPGSKLESAGKEGPFAALKAWKKPH
jgi:uncharacterized metal-binding protein YceD (DUF177 family)